jgi:hypothetical protein
MNPRESQVRMQAGGGDPRFCEVMTGVVPPLEESYVHLGLRRQAKSCKPVDQLTSVTRSASPTQEHGQKCSGTILNLFTSSILLSSIHDNSRGWGKRTLRRGISRSCLGLARIRQSSSSSTTPSHFINHLSTNLASCNLPTLLYAISTCWNQVRL